MATIVTNGVRLAYEETGTGPALLWVHGSWTDRHGAGAIVPLLAGRFRVVTYDRRGHSESERPHGGIDVAAHVGDLAGLIESLGAAPAHLLANSFGGEIALKLAARRPELVASLCLHEPYLPSLLDGDPRFVPLLEDARRRLEAVVAEVREGRNEEGARLFMETVAMGPGAWGRLPERSRRTFTQNAPLVLDEASDPTHGTLDPAEARRVTQPVMLTDGGASPAMFRAVVEQLAILLPDARTHTFPGAAHVPHLSHPEELVAAASAFLGEVQLPAP